MVIDRRRRWGNGGKAGAVLAEAFPSSCGNHQEKVAEGILVSIFHRATVSTAHAAHAGVASDEVKSLQNGPAVGRPESRSSFIDDFRGKKCLPTVLF